jgi:hypothetical protein
MNLKRFQSLLKDDQSETHWTGVARDEANADLSLAITWEGLRPIKCPTEKSEKNRTGKLSITETNDSESVHLLWAISIDKLVLVSSSGRKSFVVRGHSNNT